MNQVNLIKRWHLTLFVIFMSVWYQHCQHVSLFVEDTFDVRMDDMENKTPIQEISSNSSNRGEAIYLPVFSRNGNFTKFYYGQ